MSSPISCPSCAHTYTNSNISTRKNESACFGVLTTCTIEYCQEMVMPWNGTMCSWKTCWNV